MTAEFCGRTADTTNIGIVIRQIPYSPNILSSDATIQNQVTACSDFPSEAMLWIKSGDC